MGLEARQVIIGAAMTLIVVAAVFIVSFLLRREARKRTRLSLEERLRFETLLSELSAGLIHAAASDLDVALEQVVAFLGVDRGDVDEYVGDVPRISWALPGLAEPPSSQPTP